MKFESVEMEGMYNQLRMYGLEVYTWACFVEKQEPIKFLHIELNGYLFIIQNATWSRSYNKTFTVGAKLVPSREHGSHMSVGNYDAEVGTSLAEIMKVVKSHIDKPRKLSHWNSRDGQPKFIESVEHFNKFHKNTFNTLVKI